MPSWNYRGKRIPELEGDRNQWEQRRRFCLLSASLTASLARHGGQAPGGKHNKNIRMIIASHALNVYNAVLKSASRLSTYREAYSTRLNADGTRSGHSRAGTRNGTNAPLRLWLRAKQEKCCFHHPGLRRKCKHKCRTGKCPNRTCSGMLRVKWQAEPRV